MAIISIRIPPSDLKRLTRKQAKIKEFLKNPLSFDVLNTLDKHLVTIARNRKDQIESSGSKKKTEKNKRARAARGTLRETYKGGQRPSRTSNVKKYGRDTGTLFTDLFKFSLKPGNQNKILHKKIRNINYKFSSYSWVYKDDEQPNRIAFGMRDRIIKKGNLGHYFLFNQADRQSAKILLLRLLNAKLK